LRASTALGVSLVISKAIIAILSQNKTIRAHGSASNPAASSCGPMANPSITPSVVERRPGRDQCAAVSIGLVASLAGLAAGASARCAFCY